MSARVPEKLDPATLRWVADELLRAGIEAWNESVRLRSRGVHGDDGDSEQADLWVAKAEALGSHVRRLRARATRLERKRRNA